MVFFFEQWKNKSEDVKASGEFITKDGRVIFVGGPGGGSGGSAEGVTVVGNPEVIQRTQDKDHPLNPIYSGITDLSGVAIASDDEAQVTIGTDRRSKGTYLIRISGNEVFVGGSRPESKSTLGKYVPTVSDAIDQINKHYPVTKVGKYKPTQTPSLLQPPKVGPGSRPRLIHKRD